MDKIRTLFPNLKFDEKTHSYIIDEISLIPVTTFVSTFKQVTDWNEIAQKSADKQNKPVDLILKEWKEKRDKAAKKGTYVHNFIETRLKRLSFTGQDKWYEEMSAWEKFWQDEKKYLIPVYMELRIGDKELGLGGTVDCLMLDKRDKKYHIYDWKTGSKFDIENPWQNLLFPFEKFPDCHYSIYSIQLSSYDLILKRNTDLDLGECRIVRLRGDGRYNIYPCYDSEQTIENHLLAEF